jgi:hypothetical protein
MISALVLGRDRTKNLSERLSLFQKEFPETYHSEAVLAFWADLLMEIELGRNLSDKIELPYFHPVERQESLTIRRFIRETSLHRFLSEQEWDI